MDNLVKSELLKVSTVRSSYVLGIAALALPLLAVILQVILNNEASLLGTENQLNLFSTAGADLIAICFGIVIAAGEYRHRTITPSLLVSPNRYLFITSKAIGGLIVGVLIGVIICILVFAIGLIGLSIRGIPVEISFSEGLRTALGIILAISLSTVFGVVIGELIRNTAGAIVVTLIGILFVLPFVGIFIEHFERYTPVGALAALSTSSVDGSDRLAWWVGGLLFIGYILLIGLIDLIAADRRDIT